jgi:glycosyltransferase involved in cell wall biosynthesis
MKIIINTAHQRFGGAIQVALSFINECKNFPEHDYHVFVGYGVNKSLDRASFPSNFTFYDFDFGVIDFRKIRKIQRSLRPLEEIIKPEVIISTSGPTYYKSIAPQIIGFNLGLYIYPESPFVKSLGIKQKIILWLKKQVHYYYFKRDATAYVVQTEDVNQRVRKALNTDKVFTVSNTYSSFYVNPSLEKKKLSPKFNGEFRFLTLTSYYPHKDLELIPKIASKLESMGITHLRFILTLKQEEFEAKIVSHPYIINVGQVFPKDCPALYYECDALFLPTLVECFSASYPEAMVMKKPILTTDLGFARSICKDAALYYEPKNESDAVKKILQLTTDTSLRIKLTQNGIYVLKSFDTSSTRAKKYLDICKIYKLK